MTDNFNYIAGLLNITADALPHPPADEDADKVCAIMTAESQRHKDKKELLAAQNEDRQTLTAAERLASAPDFFLVGKKGRAVGTAVLS